MTVVYDDLTPSSIAEFGFDDPVHACRALQGMAGQGVSDTSFNSFLSVIIHAISECADADRAASNLARWAESVSNRESAYALLADHPTVTKMLITVFAASQFFADLIISSPEYLEVLTNPAIRNRERDESSLWADLSRRVNIAATPNSRRDALRRFKPPELLRIGVRDLLGFASMPETVGAISDFADVTVRMSLQICAEERNLSNPKFAVIALGKLGGKELNYASDIDLIFVHGEGMADADAIKLGAAVRDTLAKATDAGFVFRVDLRLRPEGRFGPISRTLESCRAYYESWAEPWERQALLKARFVAGDVDIGTEFAQMAEEFVYRSRVEESFVESIRTNKLRLEQKVARSGDSDVNVKEGIGGIRDIEFTVQLMQLVIGGARPHVRGGNTLCALTALRKEKLLTDAEHDCLSDSYQFLRIVEHRLQLLDELPVRNIPRDHRELRKFGRRLGYSNGTEFLLDYRRHTARVHKLFKRLFYSENSVTAYTRIAMESEWVMDPEDTGAQQALRGVLKGHRFQDVDAALDLLQRSVSGSRYGGISPEAQNTFAALAPALLQAAASTTDPDAALREMDALADAVPSRAALFESLSGSAGLLHRFCQLAVSSPPLWQTLLGHLELLDNIADEQAMDTPPTLTVASNVPALANEMRRAKLKTGARDIWGLANTSQIMEEVTAAAEMTLESALVIARQELNYTGCFAVIGLGKLGGRELSFGSDFDVLYVADSQQLTEATRLAERAQQLLRDDLAPFGLSCEMDARLRPNGRKGQLVLDIAAYQSYFSHSAATWERQALIKARPTAGDSSIGLEFTALANSVVYGTPLTDSQADEIKAMKRRIETERMKDPNDFKLGPGGLTDIEWIAQLLQLRHGARLSRLRTPNTLEALRRLRDDVLLKQADWQTLNETYLQLTSLRNRLYLRTGVSSLTPPTQPEALVQLRQATRAVCLRVFYEEATETSFQ